MLKLTEILHCKYIKNFKFVPVSGKKSGCLQAEGSSYNLVSDEVRGLYNPQCEEKGVRQSQPHVQYVE